MTDLQSVAQGSVCLVLRAAGIDAQLPPALAPFPFYFQN